MSDYEYVRKCYGVPAQYGRRVIAHGQPGIIIRDCGHYIGVNLDSDKPGVVSRFHPTDDVEYKGIGKPRKITAAQARYQRYLQQGDCFDSFMHFVHWDTSYQKYLKHQDKYASFDDYCEDEKLGIV